MYTKEMAIENGGHEINTRITCTRDPYNLLTGYFDLNYQVAPEGTEIIAEVHWSHHFDLKDISVSVEEGCKSPESHEMHVDRENNRAEYKFIMPNNDVEIVGYFKGKGDE